MRTLFHSLHHSSLFALSCISPASKFSLLSLSTAFPTISMTSFISDESFDVDKLTHDIFSLLENKFLFGSDDDSKHFHTGKSEVLDKSLLGDLKKADTGKVRILSIDRSGSIDRILAAKSLVVLEVHLCQKSGNPNAGISDFFDVATRSGVGRILVALLFTKGKDDRPIFKANEALQFIVKNHKKLIPSSKGQLGRIFPSSKVDKIFRRTFGESTLKDTLKPVLIPCYDLSTRAPFLFSRTDALDNDAYDFKMSEVCAATLADPTVLGGFKMSSIDKKARLVAIDGGVAMNNPTAAAITHVLNNKQEFPFCDGVADLLVVSLGNGVSDSSCAPNFAKICGEAASDMVDESVSMAFGEFMGSNYVRIQGNGYNIGKGKKRLEIVEQMLTQKNVESILFKGKKVAEKTNSKQVRVVCRRAN